MIDFEYLNKTKMRSKDHWWLAYSAFLVSIISFFVSLFFSNVMKFPPCTLCWYQRIALFPIVPILGIGILLKDNYSCLYSMILSLAGLLIAIYHNLLYFGIVPEKLSPCAEGISCTSRYFEWFGFIGIPQMSLLALTLISVFLFVFLKKSLNDGIKGSLR